MPLHADFKKLKASLIKQHGAEEGTRLFWATVKKRNLDETKPMPSKKEKHFESGINFKEEKEEFYSSGYAATTHPDRDGDIIPKGTLRKIVDRINSRNIQTTPDAVSIHHKREDVDLAGRGTKAELRQLPEGHWGAWVETHHNKFHPDFEKTKYELENEFISGYSIEYEVLDSEPSGVEGREGKEGKILNDIELYGYGLASPHRIINPQAEITDFGYKEMIHFENKAVLTTEARKKLSKSAFAIPEKKAYPIHDIIHARNALARVSQHGTPEEKKRVRAAVFRRYPQLKKEGEVKMTLQTKEEDKPEEAAPSEEKAAQKEPESQAEETPAEEDKKEESKEAKAKKVETKEKLEMKEEIRTQVKEELKAHDPLINKGSKFGEKMEKKEVSNWKESLNKSLSIKEQYSAAAELVNSIGPSIVRRSRESFGKSIGIQNKELSTDFDKSITGYKLEYKEMEYKALQTDTNKVSDTDYYQNAAELNDIYDPIIYNQLNDKTTFYGLLTKKDASGWPDRYGFRVRITRNATRGNVAEGATITYGQSGRLKCQIPFVFYQVGVQVTGQMIAAATGMGGVGDIYSREIEDATVDLLTDLNSDLLTGVQTGFTAGGQVLGMVNLVEKGSVYTTLYGHARSTYTTLKGNSEAMSSANVSKKQLRKMIRSVIEGNSTDGGGVGGANQADLMVVTSFTQKDKILALFDEAQRFVSTSPRAGFEGLPTFDGIPIHADKDCTNGTVFLVDMKNTFLAMQVAPTFEEKPAVIDGRNGIIKTYLQLVCTAPDHNYASTGFSTS